MEIISGLFSECSRRGELDLLHRLSGLLRAVRDHLAEVVQTLRRAISWIWDEQMCPPEGAGFAPAL
jgi:hypothetical protein